MPKTIKIEDTQYTVKMQNRRIREFIEIFENKLDTSLVSYLQENARENYEYSIKQAFFRDLSEDDFKCKCCGVIKPKITASACNLKSCQDYVKGNAFRGKKRPEFAKKMSKKMLELSKQGLLDRTAASKRINSIEFKKAGLIKNGKITGEESMSDNEIHEAYLLLKKERQQKSSYKQNCILNYINRHSSDKLVKEHLMCYKHSLNKDNLEVAYKKYNSIKSLNAMKNNPKMGSCNMWSRDKIQNLKFCKNADEVRTRSSWETNYIISFEKLKIFYGYESDMIPCESTFYIPDFTTDKYLLEVKGSFYRTTPAKYFDEKLKFGIQYAKNQNKKFYISMVSMFDPSNFIDLTNVETAAQFKKIIKEYKK